MNSREILDIYRKSGINDINVKTLIKIAFLQYKKDKNEFKKSTEYDFIPQNLIKLYYSKGSENSDFENIVLNFKKKYIVQESKVENVHTKEEIEGLGVVYDYIRSDEWKKCPNIYIIMLINLKLFSLTPYPEAGGKIRNANAYLKDSTANLVPYNQIDAEIAKLYPKFQELLKMGISLGMGTEENEDMILEYINKCLELKCRLIEIHPFQDGNGRTMRALTNLLFKIANIPPIYVKLSERDTYLKAMSSALEEQDYSKIQEFYYYKICDSILELDVNQKINKEPTLKKIKSK